MQNNTQYLSIGLMSGTSMDGIDAALLATNGDDYTQTLAYHSLRYDPAFKLLLHAAQYHIRLHRGDLDQACMDFNDSGFLNYLQAELNLTADQLNAQHQCCLNYMQHQQLYLTDVIKKSTELHAQAVFALLQKSRYQTSDITVIGYHGQTMYHQPNVGISVIVGDGQYLASLTGIAVINDFRANDIRLGGKGAPFAPIYHQALTKRDQKIPAVIVNCGGIANITLIQDDNPEHLIGFDTGPGNGLLDRLVQQRTQGKMQMDKDGAYGSQGKSHGNIIAALYQQSVTLPNFYIQHPPKALDIADLQLIAELKPLSLFDACRTLAAFTADTIVNSLNYLPTSVKQIPDTWILAGGGWYNPVIKQELAQRLIQRLGAQVQIWHADDIGWHSQALEAEIFAYFAIRSLQAKPLSVPGTTGVVKATTGGTVHLPTCQYHPHIEKLLSNVKTHPI